MLTASLILPLAVLAAPTAPQRAAGPAVLRPARVLTGHTDIVQMLAFSPDGRRLASGGDDGRVLLWNAHTGELERELLAPDDADGAGSSVFGLAFSGDGYWLAAGTGSGLLVLYDAAVAEERKRVVLPDATVIGIACAPDGRVAVADAGVDGLLGAERPGSLTGQTADDVFYETTLSFFDPLSGSEDEAAGWMLSSWVHDMAYGSNGQLLALGTDMGTVEMLQIRRSAFGDPYVIEGEGPVTSVAFSPDGRWLAACTATGGAHLFDQQSAGAGPTLAGHEALVADAAFLPDGKLVTGALDATARLWDPSNGRLHAQLHGHVDGLLAVAASPAGRQVATAGLDQTVILWDVGARAPAGTAALESERVELVEGRCAVRLPRCFEPVPSEDFAAIWPEELRPDAAFENESRSVLIGGRLRDTAIGDGGLEALGQKLAAGLDEREVVVRWIRNEVVERDGRSWLMLELDSPGGSGTIRSLIAVTAIEGHALVLDALVDGSVFPGVEDWLRALPGTLEISGD